MLRLLARFWRKAYEDNLTGMAAMVAYNLLLSVFPLGKRDAVSGISLDEEAMNMLKFQRAYEANARFFVAVDRMLDAMIGMVA